MYYPEVYALVSFSPWQVKNRMNHWIFADISGALWLWRQWLHTQEPVISTADKRIQSFRLKIQRSIHLSKAYKAFYIFVDKKEVPILLQHIKGDGLIALLPLPDW